MGKRIMLVLCLTLLLGLGTQAQADVLLLNDCEALIARGWLLAGDLNGDCVVNLADFVILAEMWMWEYAPNGGQG